MRVPAIPSANIHLHHRMDGGPSGCITCGWSGVAPSIGGERQDWCPRCETEVDYRWDAKMRLVEASPPANRKLKPARNAPCDCGSGKKSKKCCHA